MKTKKVFSVEAYKRSINSKCVKGFLEDIPWQYQCEGLTEEEMWEKETCVTRPEWMIEVEDDGELTELSDIIAQGLKANGYQGLQNDECGCGCDDLFPCGVNNMSVAGCKPAYAYECHRCKKRDDGCPTGGTDMFGEHVDILHSTSKEFCSPEYMEVENNE